MMALNRLGFSKEVEILLVEAERLFNGPREDEDLLAELAIYGVNEAMLQTGAGYYAALEAAAEAMVAAIVARDMAIEAFGEAVKSLWDDTRPLALLARGCFEGNIASLYVLGLPRGKPRTSRYVNPMPSRFRHKTVIPWLNNFYDMLNHRSDLAAVIVGAGYSAEMLQANIKRAAGLSELDIACVQARARAAMATEARDTAYRNLRRWVVNTRRLVGAAVKDRRDWGVLVGIRG